ncbi:APC family permease [SAR92 clade bacterium H246]
MTEQTQLRRGLSLPLLVLYGLGTTIGAGIYALVGKIAGESGYLAPLAFLLAAAMASLTALSFGELCRRYPYSAGEAFYVREAFHWEWVSTLVGLLVVLTGLVSAAALVNGFIGYLGEFIEVQPSLTILLVCLSLGMLAGWGIAESVSLAALVTLIEIGGLLVIVWLGLEQSTNPLISWIAHLPEQNWNNLGLIFAGATLAFYAFIGFEDMVNVAEEVRDVKTTMPRAIILTLVISTLIYLLLMMVAVLTVSPSELAKSDAPLPLVYRQLTGEDSTLISVIGLFAIINGALIQIIMAARVLYGQASMGQLPKVLAHINVRTQTPLIATALVTSLVLVLALIGDLAGLARTTSILMLTVFAFINLALWQIKRRDPNLADFKPLPIWIPVVGFFVSSGIVLNELAHSLGELTV